MLGQMRGLAFGLVKHRHGPPEVFLEGKGVRRAELSRDSQGPRACLNAAERLFAGYESRSDELRGELALAEGKLRDFAARLGAAFPHERYIEELSALRDELKVALSAPTTDGALPKARPAVEIADLIHALKGTQVVEAVAMKRPGTAATRSERHGKARLRGVAETIPAAEPPFVELEDPRKDVKLVPAGGSQAVAPSRPKLPTPGAREPRRKRYQKWLF